MFSKCTPAYWYLISVVGYGKAANTSHSGNPGLVVVRFRGYDHSSLIFRKIKIIFNKFYIQFKSCEGNRNKLEEKIKIGSNQNSLPHSSQAPM